MGLEYKPKEKVGHWIHTGEDEEWYGESYRCSLCNGIMIYGSNYCPDCGAKMQEEE